MGLAVAATGLAGCDGRLSDETTTAAETDSKTETAAEAITENAESSVNVDAAVTVATEWNAMYIRLYDTVALVATGRLGTVARITDGVFTRFEQSSGEWGVHEQLEATNEQSYGTFESHLGGAREACAASDAGCRLDLTVQAADNLFTAQCGHVDATVVDALKVLLFGARARDAGLLAAAGEVNTMAELTSVVYEGLGGAPTHSPLESASGEPYGTFETAVKGAADAGDAEIVAASVRTAVDATADTSHELAPEAVTGAGHFVFMQAVGPDAEVLARSGGPGNEPAHAATLSFYRARATDAPRLVAAGEADLAATVTNDVFAHLEGAQAHEVLEEADHGTYEGFEGGLESLTEAAKLGNGTVAEEVVATMDKDLLVGTSAFIGGEAVTVLKAASFRARLGDARELVAVSETDRVAAVGKSLFVWLEKNEANLHESIEEESEEFRHRFEEGHFAGLIGDTVVGNADTAATHAEGAVDALFEFGAAVGVTAEMSAVEVMFLGACGFDAAAPAQASASTHIGSVVQFTFAFFGSGMGGYYETLEEVDHDLYESFEGVLGSIQTAAEEGGDTYGTAKTYGQKAADLMYAVITTATADAGLGAVALERTTGIFRTFGEARVHEASEGADRDAYESSEAALFDYVSALANESEIDAATKVYATVTARTQFAVVGEVDKTPEVGSLEDGGSADVALSGGSNVVEGAPEDADHVVKMSAAMFEPVELTVSAGDTVTFEYVSGKAHSVTTYDDELPEGATYWVPGGFGSREVVETGWNEGKGAVQSDQPYVHTFETAGEHTHYCVPHEAAGITGIVVVEEQSQLLSCLVRPNATGTGQLTNLATNSRAGVAKGSDISTSPSTGPSWNISEPRPHRG